MKALSLFSGIGGLDIAAHAAGIETVAFCEIEPFAVKVLERRFPAVENHGDITRFTNRTLRELGGSPFHRFKCPADYDGTIDVVHGGFPCQDLSVAGKQRGLSGGAPASGSRCLELFPNSDPLTSLLRMCVERAISPSIPCEPEWREKVTKSGHSSFLQLYLARPTKGKGCSSSESGKMWPTVCASEARQGYQDRMRGKKGSQISLTTAVKVVEHCGLLHPSTGTTTEQE